MPVVLNTVNIFKEKLSKMKEVAKISCQVSYIWEFDRPIICYYAGLMPVVLCPCVGFLKEKPGGKCVKVAVGIQKAALV